MTTNSFFKFNEMALFFKPQPKKTCKVQFIILATAQNLPVNKRTPVLSCAAAAVQILQISLLETSTGFDSTFQMSGYLFNDTDLGDVTFSCAQSNA